MNTICKNYTLFELPTSEEKIYKLAYKKNAFVGMAYVINEDVVDFTYNITNLQEASEILKASLVDKLRFLINASRLADDFDTYTFSLDPSNLYYDFNLQVKVLERHITQNGESFTDMFRVLVGCVLNLKYSFDDYRLSDKWLYSKNKIVKQIAAESDLNAMIKKLKELYKNECLKNKNTKVLVNKVKYRTLKIFLPVCVVLMCLAFIAAGYFYFIEIPFKSAIIAAENAFLVEDYNTSIEVLHKIPAEKLPKETKYQLARAFVISESLNQRQKENILQGINIKATDTVMEYWIYLGRLEYEKAIDSAQRIRDNELLLYALLKYQVAVENDTLLTGEEKTQRLDKIISQIDALEKERSENLAFAQQQK